MNRKIALLLIVFLVFPAIAYAIKTFVIQETEKISLQPNATDPDADKLQPFYSAPLNENGQWQTTYGDAGNYTATITVSDGTSNASQDVRIIVKKKEVAPQIDSFNPQQDTLNVKETDSITFDVHASDLNNDPLAYSWYLDGKKIKEGDEFYYETNYNDAGMHKVTAVVSDGEMSTSREWQVNVENVDVEGLLGSIKDINVNENEVARLEIPDFGKYGLVYRISEPIGNSNEWKTTYDDNGTYYVAVHAEGKGFSGNKVVKVVVNDVDRPPVFEPVGNRVVNENGELRIILNANDPDNDQITFSANNMPQDAMLDGNVFTWKPGYDTVKKEDFIDRFVSDFGTLSKNFYVQFVASSRDKKVVQNGVITVKNVNRAPVLDDIQPIAANEGDTIRIVPNAYDPDGDKISISYSGFMNKDVYISKFGDAGTYSVKVTASNGVLKTSKFARVTINRVNRMPIFEKIPDIKANEGDNIALLLNAHDPDGDNINYTIENPPSGSYIKDNVFFWVPEFHAASKEQPKSYELVFSADDGKSKASQIAKAEIKYKNRAPRIINYSKNVVARVGNPVMMFVMAVDDDNDTLSYTWDFGFFDKYLATPVHQRIFTSSGTKVVRIIVSDGTDKTVQLINVNVI